jgi:protocatechuate 3,4-dioxygenase beta subunit
VQAPQVDAGATGPEEETAREEPAPEAPATAAVRGRVRDAAGAPVTRFRVLLLREAEVPDVAEPELKAFENADGAFAWDGVRPDRYEVFVEAKGFAQHRTGVIELAAGSPQELDVTLGAGRGLHGWVLERDTETPLPGASVVVESEVPSQVLPLDLTEPPEWLGQLATAGPDGGFALEDLAPGSHRLRVSAAGHAPEWVPVEVPADGSPPEVLAHLGPGGGIAGVVTDAGGRPIAGSLILASFAGTRLFSFEQALTDADGHYAFEHLAPGLHMLIRWDTVAAAESGATPDLRPAMVSLGRVTQIDFRADRAALRIAGRFLDASGAPIPRQKFTLLRPDANNLKSVEKWQAEVTDASGAYSIKVPGPGKYLVFATYGMGGRLSLVDSFEAEAGAPELTHDVRLPATHAACTVLRADDRRPVASAVVVAVGLGDGGEEWFAGRAGADAAGVARLDALQPGRYLLIAASDEATDLGQAASAPFEIPAGGAAPQLELMLPEGGALRVLAVDRAGVPLEGASLALRTERGAEVHLLVDPLTDRDGRVTLLGLAPGAYAVTAEREGFAPATASAEVRAALGGDLRIQLEPLR